MRDTIVFDVNETLLDLSALDAPFKRYFSDAGVRVHWFAQVLQSALTTTILGHYRSFAEIGRAALEMIAVRKGVSLDDRARSEILGTMRALPPHPEVPQALNRLKDAGFRLAALTNSSPVMIGAQLKNSGLAHLFERVLSVESVHQFKPARAVYNMAAKELGEKPDALWLVAAHNWDTSGAINAGWRAAFVQRPGMVLGPLDAKPQIIGRDIAEVADRLIEALGG